MKYDVQRRVCLFLVCMVFVGSLQPLASLPQDFVVTQINPMITTIYYRLGTDPWGKIDAAAPAFSLTHPSYEQQLSLVQYAGEQQIGPLLHYRYDERLQRWIYDQGQLSDSALSLEVQMKAEEESSKSQTLEAVSGDHVPLAEEAIDDANSIIQTIPYGETYGDLPTPIKEGKRFLGWYSEVAGGQLIEPDTPLVVTADHMLYAHWVDEMFEVTLNPMGGYFDQSEIDKKKSKKTNHLSLSIGGSYHHTTEGLSHLYTHRYGGDVGLSISFAPSHRVEAGIDFGVQYARSKNIWADAYLIANAGIRIGYVFNGTQRISMVPSIGYDLLIHYGLECSLEDDWYLSHQALASVALQVSIMPTLTLFVEPMALFMIDKTSAGFLFGARGGVRIEV